MRDEDRYYTLPVFRRKALMDVAQWATSTRYMPQTASMFSYAQTPYFELPAHYMSDLATTSMVVLKTPAQVGKTVSIENFLGWMYTYYPSNTMLILDSKNSGIKMSHNRIRPFLREVCGVNNPRNTKKNPDKSNSVINIGLGRGASLFVCSSKSISDLRSTPSRFVLCDEVDAYVDTPEGDPIELALKRQMRFRGMAILTSTPTTADGRITQHFLLGTQQTWGCVCECGAFLDVKYKDISYDGDTPTYACKSCGLMYDETAIKQLEHRYSAPKNSDPMTDNLGRVRRSFEVTAPLCHAFYSWDGLKRAEIASLSLGESSYQSFVNTTIGETYTPRDDIQVSEIDLMRLSMDTYTHDCIPSDVDFIVCGMDTHDKFLFCETVGFSADLKRMYGLRYDIFPGDPNEPEVWAQFYDVFKTVYTREDGQLMRPAFVFADSGGHRTNAIYIQSKRNRRLMPIKGMVSIGKNAQDPLVGKQQKLKMNGGLKGKCTVQFVGVNAGKDELAQAEVLTVAGDKVLHYIRGNGYDQDYFKGLLSEKKIDGKWVAPSKGHTHNEPLDCRVYAMACARYYRDKYYLTGLDMEGVEMAKKKKQECETKDESCKVEEKHNEKPAEHVEENTVKETTKKNFPHM